MRFNNIYLKQSSLPTDNIPRLEFILQNASHQPGCILKNQIDKTLVRPMVEAIIREYVNRDLYNQELIHQLVNTLIVVVARNIAKYITEQVHTGTDDKALTIINYIQDNIYAPEKTRAEVISQHFGISETYLG